MLLEAYPFSYARSGFYTLDPGIQTNIYLAYTNSSSSTLILLPSTFNTFDLRGKINPSKIIFFFKYPFPQIQGVIKIFKINY